MQRRAILPVSLIALAAGALAQRGQEERGLIPEIPSPRPIPAEAWEPVDGPIRLVVTELALRTSIGTRIRVPRAEIVAPAPLTGDTVRITSIRVSGASVISPADSIDTPFDAFMRVPGPRVLIDRFTLEGAVLGARAHPSQYEGEWLWRQEDVDIVLANVRFGGDGPLGTTVARADFRGEVRGRPLRVERLTGWLVRGGRVLESDLQVSLGTTRLDLSASLRRDGAYALQLVADTLLFEEVRAVLRAAPDTGSAAGVVRISGDEEGMRVGLPAVRAHVGASSILVRGSLRTGAVTAADSLRIETGRLHAADLEALLGASLPIEGVWRGGVIAHGRAADGLRVDGALDRTDGSGTLAIDGEYRDGDALTVDASVSATGLRLADGELEAHIAARGPIEAMVLTGGFDLRTPWPGTNGDLDQGAVPARLNGTLEGRATLGGSDATRGVSAAIDVRGTVRGREVSAHATATAMLGGERTLNAAFETAALPLAVLPAPASLDSVRGTLTARGSVTGTLDEPLVTARVDVEDGSFHVPALRMSGSTFDGSILIEDGVARIERFAGRAGGGEIRLAGEARLWGGERSVDARASASDVALLDADTTAIVAGGQLHVSGALAAPRAEAELALRRRGTPAILARLDGGAVLDDGGVLNVRIVADSLPLEVVPATDAITDLHGAVTGDVMGAGTLSEPSWTGALRLEDAGFTVRRTGTRLDSLAGDVRVGGESASLELAGRAGAGTVRVDGTVRFARAPRTLALSLHADHALLVVTDSAHVIASAELSADGPLARPRVGGTVVLAEGWIHEDNFKRQAPLDPSSPPFEELRREAPWFAPRADEEPPLAVEAPPDEPPQVPAPPQVDDGPPFTGGVTVEIMPGIRIIDEDSEMYGRGTIEVRADSGGVTADGVYRIHDGFYANFGERFRVVGGAFVFSGMDVEPRVTLRAEHADDTPLVSGIEEGLHAFEWYPPLEFFAIGTPSVVSEELRRSALLPENQTELASYLLTQSPTEPVTGWRARPWPSGDGGELAGARAGAQSLPLLWAYIADEGYDYLPLGRAYLRAGIIDIGSEYPAPITVSPLLRAAARLGRWQAILSQPAAAWPRPGVRLRYRAAGLEIFAFEEPRYRAASRIGGGLPPYDVRRRSGVGLRWRREF